MIHRTISLSIGNGHLRGNLFCKCGSGFEIATGGSAYELNCDASTNTIPYFEAANLDSHFLTLCRIDPAQLHLLDGYFSLAMAIDTTDRQPLTRAMKSIKSLPAPSCNWIGW
tara:strand:- start:362 stop:697 length:336 start_codon:yes stop_codon:yes gene_type:complete